MIFRLFVLALVFITGCSSLPQIISKPEIIEMPQIIRWLKIPAEPMAYQQWLEEAKKRWKNPIIFACHGAAGYAIESDGASLFIKRMWFLYPEGDRTPMPVEEMAWSLHNLYPDHDIVLCVCNPKGEFECHVPRVWFAKDLVWVTPDGHGSIHEGKIGFGAVGNVWEFQMGDGKTRTFKPASQPSTQPVK